VDDFILRTKKCMTAVIKCLTALSKTSPRVSHTLGRQYHRRKVLCVQYLWYDDFGYNDDCHYLTMMMTKPQNVLDTVSYITLHGPIVL
jgi:hypothetical protein